MNDKPKHYSKATSRRQFFEQAGSGLAAIALTSMMAEEGLAQAKKLASGAPGALALTKELLLTTSGMSLQGALDHDQRHFAAV